MKNKIDQNLAISNSPSMKAEMKNWAKWVYIVDEIQNLELSIFCRYTEAFSLPFKFYDLLLNSYGNREQRIGIRPEQSRRALKEFDDPFNQSRSVESVVSDHPDAFMLVPRLNGWGPAYQVNFSFDKKIPPGKVAQWFKDNFGLGDWDPRKTKHFIGYFDLSQDGKLKVGRATGRVYVDLYGYLWFEIKVHYLEDASTIGWVRESAVNYEGKEVFAAALGELQNEVMSERYDTESQGNNNDSKKSLSYLLSGAMLLLTLKQ